MYKLVYKLEALSEMVHFQIEDATSATIRASELKPMFDRYLTAYLKHSRKMEDFSDLILDSNESDDDGQREVGNQDDYLHFDYQVRIEIDNPVSNKIVPYDASEKFFFEDNKTKKKKFVLLRTEPVVHFLTPHATLASLIHENFEYFIAISFFGYRKGKYYGQFCVKEPSFNLKRSQLITDGFARIGKEVRIAEVRAQGMEPVTAKFVNTLNSKLKTVPFDLIENPDILNKRKSFLRDGREAPAVIAEVKKKNILKRKPGNQFGGIQREKYLKKGGPKGVSADKLRYMRGLFGLSTNIGDFDIEGEGVSRFPNPMKYYLAFPENKKIQSVYCVIDIESVDRLVALSENGQVRYRFNSKSRDKRIKGATLTLPRKAEFDYSGFWDLIYYLLPKLNLNAGQKRGGYGGRTQNRQNNRPWTNNGRANQQGTRSERRGR
ncbi:TPA: hypothetical protein U0J99_000384 [Streptococcus suis]|nr:hypothetical protein [Streptococcus suis]